MSPARLISVHKTETLFHLVSQPPLIHVTNLNIFNFMMSQPGAKHMSVCKMSIYGSYHRWLLAMYHRYIIVELLSLWDILFMHCLPIQAQLSAALYQW